MVPTDEAVAVALAVSLRPGVEARLPVSCSRSLLHPPCEALMLIRLARNFAFPLFL